MQYGGWGNNTAGECGGTDKNWYINDDGILIDEGYLNVTSPIKISAGSKYGMFTIGLTTYILDQNGNMSCMGADNYALYQADKETEISLTHNISNIGRTTDDQIIIIYKNGDIIYQRGDSIFYADFSLNNIKNIIDNVVITEDGQAYALEFNCTDSKDGGNCNDGLKMTALPVNNVKCISGNVDNTYFALKKDDTIWYWNRNDDGSVSEACRLYSESGEIGSGTVIISEEYGKPGTEYYRLGQSQLEEKGWAEIENNNKSGRNQQSAENGEFTASEG